MFPPRGSCPTDGVALAEDVELGNSGTVTTYCVVNVPFQGQSIEIPYICAQILLDGANLSFMGLSRRSRLTRSAWGCGWRPCGRTAQSGVPTMASVKHFRPNGEPDADYESYKEYL